MTTLCPNCNAPMLDWAQSRSCPNCGIETDLYGKVTQQPVRLVRHDLSDTATDLMLANAEVKTLKAHSENLRLDYLDMQARAEKAEAELAEMQEANRWRNANTEPPTEDGRYLTAIKYKPGMSTGIRSYAKTVSKYMRDNGVKANSFYDYDSEYGYYSCNDVVYWRPLPEPPQDTAVQA